MINPRMFSDQEIQQLALIFATKGDLVDLEMRMDKKFNRLLTAVDNYAAEARKSHQELTFLTRRISCHSDWFKIVGRKLGINFEE